LRLWSPPEIRYTNNKSLYFIDLIAQLSNRTTYKNNDAAIWCSRCSRHAPRCSSPMVRPRSSCRWRQGLQNQLRAARQPQVSRNSSRSGARYSKVTSNDHQRGPSCRTGTALRKKIGYVYQDQIILQLCSEKMSS
ncbi:hypothetical protein ANCCAN_13582, partial [Ancylostoma caninum]